jgi:flavin reductase (DIM6/NTAB) family NADH-FMN oxidoreductase RutF
MKIEQRPGTDLAPVPVVLVTAGEGEAANMVTIGWVGMVNSTPPMVGVAVRPSRHTYKLLCAAREFVVNVPRAADVAKVDTAGVVSGEQVRKFADIGFTPVGASRVKAPLIAECPVNLECRLRHQLSLGSHDLFIGEIVACHFDEDVLDARGRFQPSAEVGLTLHGYEYWSLGQKLGDYGQFGKAWQAKRKGASPVSQ